MRWTSQNSGRDGEASGIIKHSGPAHTKFSTIEARTRTFRDWPPALKQQPKDLAAAGFFYIGYSDQVKCFYCDGGLRNWQPEDDPWTEHSRWFAQCGFVRLVKGDEFIAKCLAERPPEDVAPMNSSHDEAGGSGTTSRRRELDEAELRRIMSSPLVEQALALGIDAARIKMAMKRHFRETGAVFQSVNDLVNASFAEQRSQEDRHGVENNASSAAFSRRRDDDDERQQPMEGVIEEESTTAPTPTPTPATTATESHDETGASSSNVSACVLYTEYVMND